MRSAKGVGRALLGRLRRRSAPCDRPHGTGQRWHPPAAENGRACRHHPHRIRSDRTPARSRGARQRGGHLGRLAWTVGEVRSEAVPVVGVFATDPKKFSARATPWISWSEPPDPRRPTPAPLERSRWKDLGDPEPAAIALDLPAQPSRRPGASTRSRRSREAARRSRHPDATFAAHGAVTHRIRPAVRAQHGPTGHDEQSGGTERVVGIVEPMPEANRTDGAVSGAVRSDHGPHGQHGSHRPPEWYGKVCVCTASARSTADGTTVLLRTGCRRGSAG